PLSARLAINLPAINVAPPLAQGAVTLVALTIIGGLITSRQAAAQNPNPGSVTTRNLDEPGRNPYAETVTFQGFCQSVPCDININFPAIPIGKRLVITDVSGILLLRGGVGGLQVRSVKLAV